MCLGLWLASGFGGRLRTEPFQSRHYAVMKWFLNLIYNAGTSTFGVRVEVDEPPLTAEEEAARLARPVIVLSRHAGPGDSFLLVHHLLAVYNRRPRIVLKATMQLDPGIDVVLNRVPTVFISGRHSGGKIYTEQIRRLAYGLDQATRWSSSPRAATGRRAGGSAASSGSSSWAATWPRGPARCRTCCRRAAAGR